MAKETKLDPSWEPVQTNTETILGGFEVDLGMRGRCNYKCHYCIAQYGPPYPEPVLYDLAWLEKLYYSLWNIEEPGRKVFVVTSLECGVSEPTIHPQIRDILELITQFGTVMIPTNNSILPNRWVPKARAQHITATAALHPQGEKNLEGFLGRLKAVRDSGVHVTPMLVAHPLNIPKIKRYRAYFQRHGFRLSIRQFRGPHEGKFYPRDYNEEERRALGILEETEKAQTVWNRRMVLPTRDFCGIPCFAGYRKFFTRPPCTLQRCLYVKPPLKKLLRKATPCPIHGCPCGLYLEELNRFNVLFWNGWRRVAGWPLIPKTPDFAARRDIWAEYQVKQGTYWDLMRRYGKIDEHGNLLVGTGLPQDPYQEKPLEGQYGPT